MIFDGNTIKSSGTVDLLGITLDKNINFKRHIENICCEENSKTKTDFCIKEFLNQEQAQNFGRDTYSAQF